MRKDVSTIARERQVKVIFVASYHHKPNKVGLEEQWVFVDPDDEASDLYILNKLKHGEIVITDDIGFASLALSKGAYVLSSRGKEYKEKTIELALHFRYMATKARRSKKYGKGPRPFTEEDRHQFRRSLQQLLLKLAKIER